MKLVDTTDASAYAGVRTLVSSANMERETHLAGKFRIHLLGMYFSVVGPEWGSRGKRQSDYLHRIDITLFGRRRVAKGADTPVRGCQGKADGQAWAVHSLSRQECRGSLSLR